jgi:hypothetical protein
LCRSTESDLSVDSNGYVLYCPCMGKTLPLTFLATNNFFDRDVVRPLTNEEYVLRYV